MLVAACTIGISTRLAAAAVAAAAVGVISNQSILPTQQGCTESIGNVGSGIVASSLLYFIEIKAHEDTFGTTAATTLP